MAAVKLNQVIAIEGGVKTRVESFVTALYHAAQKPALFDGLSRIYKPLAEGAERLPQETKVVQQRANDILREVARAFGELTDITATKDIANTLAEANVEIEGQELLPKVPATFLLFLEKKLVDLHTMVSKLPVLDPAEVWAVDTNDGLYKTKVTETARTLKVQEPVVLYPATPEHPAQTQLVSRDVIVGYYEAVRMSGALPQERQRAILSRIEALQKAVKFARERANQQAIDEIAVGAKLFAWLFQ